MAAPASYYRDPAEHLEQMQDRERTCRVCIYNDRHRRECLHPRARANYPHGDETCAGFKHREH